MHLDNQLMKDIAAAYSRNVHAYAMDLADYVQSEVGPDEPTAMAGVPSTRNFEVGCQ